MSNETMPEFGDYVEIEQKRFGVPNEMYCYKVIGTLESNHWTDVPVHSGKGGGVLHDKVEPVVAAICCGISEDKVERFRLSDVRITKRRFRAQSTAGAAGGPTAGDAVFAFSAMLTSLPHVIPLGAAAWATPGVVLASAFNEANGLTVSRDFPEGLRFPEIEGKLLDTVKKAAEEASPASPPVEGQDDQSDEDAYVIQQLGRLLAQIAVIVKGPEPAGTLWSYHDLPALVERLKDTQRADLVDRFRRCSYAVCTTIDPRGYRWSEAYLDEMLRDLAAGHDTPPEGQSVEQRARED